jgi:D-aminopeptidase
MPAEVSVEYAWSALADTVAAIPGVRRPHVRTVAWTIPDPRFIYNWPSPDWHPVP